MNEVCGHHIFQGISLPNNGTYLSHLMYAGDVTFVGEWTEVNFINRNRLLRCFYIASNLKVNLCKSTVFGVSVDNTEVARFASILNCDLVSFSFTDLGLPIGANMRLSRNWKVIIDKFKSKLSSWKGKNLSFGGRLTLVKSVFGSLPLYYFAFLKPQKK